MTAATSFDFATLGEALAVFAAPAGRRIASASTFDRYVGGAELNVAVCLARLGHNVAWVGAVGDDELGHAILRFLRGEQVDTGGVRRDSRAPTGFYIREQVPAGDVHAVYYRHGSAASRMDIGRVDQERLFAARTLHLTGITPLLSPRCRSLCASLAAAARSRRIVVSFDVNVRKALLRSRKAHNVFDELLRDADLIFMSESECELILGTSDQNAIRQLRRELGASAVVVHGAHSAYAVTPEEESHVAGWEVVPRDLVGAGDAFVAGYLSAHHRGLPLRDRLSLAHCCGASAVASVGDAESMPTSADIAAMQRGDAYR